MSFSSIGATVKELKKLRAAKRTTAEYPEDLSELIGMTPHPGQQHLTDIMRRFNVFIMHRRWGKSVWAVRALLEKAVECSFRDGRYAYLGPTYAQTEDIAWTYLQNFTEKFPDRLVEKGKLAVTIPTKAGGSARIRLYGVDSPKQRLRGAYLDGVVLDEYADIPLSVWTDQVRPMLSDEPRSGYDLAGNVNQWAVFCGTPKGRNHFYHAFMRAKAWYEGRSVKEKDPETYAEIESVRDDWAAALIPASESGILTNKELMDARVDIGESKYQQEYQCSFDAAVVGAIFSSELELMRQQGRVSPLGINPYVPVWTGWDLGWDDATAIWFAQVIDGTIRVIDYYEASGAPLEHYADVLAERGYRYAGHYFPHDVEVHELGSGKSRRSTLKELGIRVTTVPKVGKPEQIAAGRALMHRSNFDPTKCQDGLDKLALYRREYDEKLQVLRQNPVHDWASHAADAWMTMAMGMRSFRSMGVGNPSTAEM